LIDLGNGILPAFESRPSRITKGQTYSLSILLAEDNEVNQKVALKILEKHNHYVTVVDNGLDAFVQVKERKFDAVLMDIQMPVMGGFESTAKIREHEHSFNLPRMPIIALTAHAMFGDRERCIEAGMDCYLSKPLNPDQMIQTILKYTTSTGTALVGND
jgi:osomolarity two-component system sensor histidine kinase NIK1